MNTSRLPVSTCFALDTAACTIACWITRSKPSVGSGSTGPGAGTGVNVFPSTSVTCVFSLSRSTPQIARTRRACGSSVIANSRCSRPTLSCRRSVATRNARWIVSSVSGANGTGVLLILGFGLHRHQQRELMLFGKLPRGLQFRFGDVMGIDAGNPHSGSMHAHHDCERFAARLVKDRLQYPDDEVLGG